MPAVASLQTPGVATADTVFADVAVIGGGLGGIAAALAAADAGASVVLTAEESMIGGQVTAQLTAPLDEHARIETSGATRSYRRFRDLVRAASGGVDNPGDGWVSRLCFEPLVGLDVLQQMLRPHIDSGRMRVVVNARPCAATDAAGAAVAHGTPVDAIRLQIPERPDLLVRAHAFVDATELGELLPLTGTAWTIGSEGSDAFGETDAVPGAARPQAEQSCTWAAILVRDAGPGPVIAQPAGYATLRDAQPFSLDLIGADGSVAPYRFFTTGPTGLPAFWSYRRIRTGRSIGAPEAAVVNWAGNDYRDSGLVHCPETTRRGARALTLAFVHWLRTEAPRDPEDGPGPLGTGLGYPELRLAPELSGTPDGLAEAAYVRESRRLANPRPLTGQDIAALPSGAPATEIPDSVAIAWYHADLHPRVGHPTSVYRETAPFQIPARTLVPDVGVGPANLVMGAKNLAATQVAASACRVHPAEWAIGEAAGALAACSVTRRTSPRRMVDSTAALAVVQRALLDRGAPLSWRVGPRSHHESAPTQTEIHMSARTPDPAHATHGKVIDRLRGQLVVSCQARPGEPLYGPGHMVAMALSAIAGGAQGLRIEGPVDIRAVRAVTSLPIIGLWKIGDSGVYITPTLAAARDVLEAGADIVALDGTARDRPDGLSLSETIRLLKGDVPTLVLADVSTLEEGLAAQAAGADLVSTTLSGYTPQSRPGPEPDLDLVAELASALRIPVLAEGRIANPDQARIALERGAAAVVIGSAITRPQVITASFVRQTSGLRLDERARN